MKKVVSVLLTITMMIAMMSTVLAFPVTIGTPTAPGNMGSSVQMVLGVLQWVGYAFAVGMLIFIGIKYAMSAANEKADLKKGLINFVIGAVLIAAAASVCGWIAALGDSIK